MSVNQKYPFPYEFTNLEPELASEIKSYLPEEKDHREFVQVGPQKWLLPTPYKNVADVFYNFEFRADDVIIITFPRSGTTVTQEMAWLLCNDLDYQKAAEKHLVDRFPYIEYTALFPKGQDHAANASDPKKRLRWEQVADSTEKRFIKLHLPFALLPPNLTKIGCKIIYVARNPRDVAVSNYYLDRLSSKHNLPWKFREFWNLFEKDLKTYCPYWDHIKDGWSKKDEENVLFMFYEDITKDLRGAIEKVAQFLDKSCTPEQLDKLENHLDIKNFRNNKSVVTVFDKNEPIKQNEGFVREGKTGGWREYFDEEMNKSAEDWIENNLKDTDLRFPS